jgi:hypothetical protein
MTITERRRRKVEEFVTPQLEQGEQIQAILSYSQTGPSPWFAALTYLIFFWIRPYAVVVTDRSVLFVRRSLWTNRIKGIESTAPRNDVTVAQYKPPPTLWGKLVLNRPGGPLKLNVHRMNREELDALVPALGGAPPTA